MSISDASNHEIVERLPLVDGAIPSVVNSDGDVIPDPEATISDMGNDIDDDYEDNLDALLERNARIDAELLAEEKADQENLLRITTILSSLGAMSKDSQHALLSTDEFSGLGPDVDDEIVAKTAKEVLAQWRREDRSDSNPVSWRDVD